MRKILHISANQLPHPGKNHHTNRIWEELAKGFDEYHLIGRSDSNRFISIKSAKIHQHLVPALGKRNRSFFLTGFYMFWIIHKHRITHLLSQSPIWGGFAGILASKLFRIPIMVEIHGDVYFHYFNSKNTLHRILGSIAKYTLKRATRVRSLSSRMTELLKENGISENVVEIPNRVNLELFGPPKQDYKLNDPIRIISIGRFVNQKGYDLAIRAVLQLKEQYNIKLDLVGGGALKPELEGLAKENKDIILSEWVEQENLIEMIRNSDIYIQPSRPGFGEAMPRTILEAMALALPIIATNIAAIPGILQDGKNALLIEPENTSSLVDAIITLIQGHDLREKLGQGALKDAREKYEWNKMFNLYRHYIVSMTYENH